MDMYASLNITLLQEVYSMPLLCVQVFCGCTQQQFDLHVFCVVGSVLAEEDLTDPEA